MANSFILFPAQSGQTTDYQVPFEYLDRAFVKATVGGDTSPFTFVSTYMVRFDVPPVGDLKLYRETSKALINEYTNGSVLDANDLNISFYQTLHITQEISDSTLQNDTDGGWTFGGLRVKDVGEPQQPDDAVTKRWAETSGASFVAQSLSNAGVAQAAATVATTKANDATASANAALTRMNTAIDQAAISTDRAAAALASQLTAEAASGTAIAKASEAESSATITTTKASEALLSAATATAQAGIATAKALDAAGSAIVAAGQAGIATEHANAAIAAAASITFWSGTQAQYDAIDPKVPTTHYFIVADE